VSDGLSVRRKIVPQLRHRDASRDGGTPPLGKPWWWRGGWAVSYCVLTLLGYFALFGPSNRVWRGDYLTPSLGDQVQITYYLWLWWHSIVTLSHAPWVDPFQFAATGHVTYQTCCWPLVVASLPVQAAFGPIAAFNAVFYASYVAAAGAMYLWMRELGQSRAAAAVAGFAFAFAPFRLVQKWHPNALLSFLLPLSLFFAERALRGDARRARLAAWCCAATIVSLAASGEFHVVAYFAPVFVVYVAIRAWGVPRERLRTLLVPFLALGAGAVFFVGVNYWLTFRSSLRAAQGIGDNALVYAPRLGDLVRHTVSEREAYPGIAVFLLAALGTVSAFRKTRYKLLVAFLVCVIGVAYGVALLPGLGRLGLRLYQHAPVVSLIQVPGRTMLLACLCFAVLAGFGFSAIRMRNAAGRAALVVAIVVVMIVDGRPFLHGLDATPVDPNLMPTVPRGASVLDLPPFEGGHAGGSRYELQIIYNPGPRVGGYSVTVPQAVFDAQQKTVPLVNLPVDSCRWLDVSRSVKFDYVAVYRGLFGRDFLQWHSDGEALVRALDRTHGFEHVSSVKDTVVYRFTPTALACRRP